MEVCNSVYDQLVNIYIIYFIHMVQYILVTITVTVLTVEVCNSVYDQLVNIYIIYFIQIYFGYNNRERVVINTDYEIKVHQFKQT